MEAKVGKKKRSSELSDECNNKTKLQKTLEEENGNNGANRTAKIKMINERKYEI